jgi:4a-hydroxytetrahydrobiopterin dehydratase
MAKLSTAEILAADLADWRKLAQALHTRYRIPDFGTGASFVAAVADAAETAGHHPDLTLRYGLVDLALATHEAGMWVTEKDVELAREITAIAQRFGLVAEPGAVTQVELGLDSADDQRAGPFWSALLTGSPDNRIDDTVLDPTGRVPNVWFQRTEAHETPRQRWHLDVWVAPEVADERIAAALAAGGTLVDDSGAPSFTVLADPEGNKVCVCTCLDRD